MNWDSWDCVLVVGGDAVVEGVMVWLVGPPLCPRSPLTLALSRGGDHCKTPVIPADAGIQNQ